MSSDGITYIPRFKKINEGIEVILKLLTILEAAVLVLLTGGIYEVRH
jgi:hypothetical protein